MAIDGLMGQPGAGKSFEAVRVLIEAIEEGRKIVTNLPLRMDAIRAVYEDKADLVELRTFTTDPETWKAEPGSLVIADEVADILQKGMFGEDLHQFFRMGRHEGLDFLLITQAETSIAPEIRKMMAVVDECFNMEGVGVSGFYKVTRYRMVQGQRKETIDTRRERYTKKIYSFYESRTMGGGGGSNKKRRGIVPFWRRPRFLIPIGFIVAVAVAIVTNNPLDALTPGLDDDGMLKSPPTSSAPSPRASVRRPGALVVRGVGSAGYLVQKDDAPAYWLLLEGASPVAGRCALEVAGVIVECGSALP